MSKTAVISLTKQLIYDRWPSFFLFFLWRYLLLLTSSKYVLTWVHHRDTQWNETIEVHGLSCIYKSNNDEDDDDLKNKTKNCHILNSRCLHICVHKKLNRSLERLDLPVWKTEQEHSWTHINKERPLLNTQSLGCRSSVCVTCIPLCWVPRK